MPISFRKHEEFFTFHDPMQDEKLIDRKTEIRFDPLTGETSRIIFDPGAPFIPKDYSQLAKETEGVKCPFCAENVSKITPRFPDELVEGGRFIAREAIVFPNLFPYSKHNAVVRMSNQHYVKPEEFTEELIADSFKAAHQYIEKVLEFDNQTEYVSINWNYLPPSGGSILHPHIQVLASEQPTNYQSAITTNSHSFYEKEGENYLTSLVSEERNLGERWIGHVGSISWLHAYAPKSHYDFIGIFEAASFDELGSGNYEDLAKSMLRFFLYFKEQGVESFNAVMHIPVKKHAAEQVHFRLVPRMTIGMLETSDMNVFNFLQGEPLSLKSPETVAKEVGKFFNEGK
ncbi:hypothetical protein QTL97_15555 [Sporosarcina thermotolerans]|uniref:Galactose-1-phosphate uridylyltransferase n=2 Tax=Sporosarcina thermotolerans TaxID=633404 RepID=A0AAW9AA51_9BACL|nr:hypothetical protein [Sporosarcina thermotolerans]MDW0118347.1 hypothetical protein [Sporosarcina thermotolerans]